MVYILLMVSSLLSVSYGSISQFSLNNIGINYSNSDDGVVTSSGDNSFEYGGETHSYVDGDEVDFQKIVRSVYIPSKEIIFEFPYGFISPVTNFNMVTGQMLLNQQGLQISSPVVSFETTDFLHTLEGLSLNVSTPSGYTSLDGLVDYIISGVVVTFPKLKIVKKSTGKIVDLFENVSLQAINGKLMITGDVDSWFNYALNIQATLTNDKTAKIVEVKLDEVRFGPIGSKQIILNIFKNMGSSKISVIDESIFIRY